MCCNECRIQHCPECETTISGNLQTLCCSRALWTVCAVASCAYWTTNSCLRAPSASCSQVPTASRGAGRDLSRWRCQSRSCSKKYGFLINKEILVFSLIFFCSNNLMKTINEDKINIFSLEKFLIVDGLHYLFTCYIKNEFIHLKNARFKKKETNPASCHI